MSAAALTTTDEALQRQALENQIKRLEGRVRELKSNNKVLRDAKLNSEKETKDFVAYFQGEMENRDETIGELKRRCKKVETESHDSFASTKAYYESELLELKTKSKEENDALSHKLKDALHELNVLAEFKENKLRIEARVEKLESDLVEQERKHHRVLVSVERKFLEEKAKLQKEFESRVEGIRDQCWKEAQEGLDTDTRKIIADNKRLGEELRFQMQMAGDLQIDRNRLAETTKSMKRDIALLQEKDKEFARQSFRQTREVKASKTKAAQAEKRLAQAISEFENEKRRASNQASKKIEDLSIEVAALKRYVDTKDKEMKKMRRLAQTILNQRSEVEQYFLESLSYVKAEIREQRQKRHEQNLMQYKASMRAALKDGATAFPRIKTSGQLLAESMHEVSKLPVGPGDKVDVSDLTWEDRERVLKLLFAKINAVEAQADAPPKHSLVPPESRESMRTSPISRGSSRGGANLAHPPTRESMRTAPLSRGSSRGGYSFPGSRPPAYA